jgi:hypothetical protein
MTLPLEKMTREEKLQAMEALWIDLTRNEKEYNSPDWHKDILELREKRIQSGQEKYQDWESAKKDLRDRLL